MTWIKNTVFGIGGIGCRLDSLFLLVVRLYWGWLFVTTGYGKFSHIDGVISFFTQLGLPMPEVTAYVIATLELLGGICLFFGLWSRFVGLVLMCVLFGAYSTAHSKAFMSFFSDPQLFISQEPFSYLMASMICFFCGPGRWSVDRCFCKRD